MSAIYKKEVKTYFTSIMGYVFLGILLFVIGMYYTSANIVGLSTDFGLVLSSVTAFIMFLIPAITMRLVSEEMRQKTDQLLLTSPTSVSNIVLGKFFAATTLFLTAVVITIIFPIIMSNYGTIPVGKIFVSYIGFILFGMCYIAVGLFISSLTENVVISAVASFAALFLFYILGFISSLFPSGRTPSIAFMIIVCVLLALLMFYLMRNVYISAITLLASIVVVIVAVLINNTVFDGIIVNAASWISLSSRYDSFGMGILNIGDIVYLISFAAVFIFLTISTIEKRRWS